MYSLQSAGSAQEKKEDLTIAKTVLPLEFPVKIQD